jgi:hypothetical protein
MSAKTKIDLTGKTFGRLKVLYDTGDRRSGHVLWKCLCVCGRESVVSGNSLRDGSTRSCGCRISESRRRNANRVGWHGHSVKLALYSGGSIEDLEDLIR